MYMFIARVDEFNMLVTIHKLRNLVGRNYLRVKFVLYHLLLAA